MEIYKLLKGRPLRIMKLLGADWKGKTVSVNGGIEMDVTTIEKKLRNGSQSSVSQDLARLRKEGLLQSERRGLHVHYKLSENFSEILNNLGEPAAAIEKHHALEKGKNRQLVVKWLTDNPGSKTADICPQLHQTTVCHELAVLRKAGVLEISVGEKNKKLYSIKNQ